METSEKPVVLMVDDDKEYRDLACAKFEGTFGHHFLEAASFEEAVEVIPTISGISVAFVDIHLKGKSGLEVLAWIQNHFPHRVVPYCLTANNSFKVIQKALDAGAFHVFDKDMVLPEKCGYTLWDLLALRAETKFVKRLLSKAFGRRLPGFWNLEAFRMQVEPMLEVAAPREGVKERRDDKHFGQFALIFIEVANWKTATLSLDLSLGDRVAESVARTIKRHVRPTDHLCRIGDDEFAALLPDVSESRAREIATSIRDEPVTAMASAAACPVQPSLKVGIDHVERADLTGQPALDLDMLIYNARSVRA